MRGFSTNGWRNGCQKIPPKTKKNDKRRTNKETQKKKYHVREQNQVLVGKIEQKMTSKKSQQAFISWHSVSRIGTKPTFFNERTHNQNPKGEKQNQHNPEITWNHQKH